MAWLLSHAMAKAENDELHAVFGQRITTERHGNITDTQCDSVSNTTTGIEMNIKVYKLHIQMHFLSLSLVTNVAKI